MKIKVLEYTLEDDLTDHEKVFSCFMAYMQGNHESKNVRYYMYSDDIKHILGHIKPHLSQPRTVAQEYKLHKGLLDNIQKSFKIGMVNDATWTVEFIQPDDKYKAGNGKMNIVETDIQDIEAIKVYYYLMGRLSGTETILNDGIEMREGNSAKTTVLHSFFKNHAMI